MSTDACMISGSGNKRHVPDRRRRPTPMISKYTLHGGRRKTIRRETDKKQYLFVDLYSTRLLVIVVAILILSCIDAALTLALIDRGIVREANPFMASVLDYGVLPFTLIKFGLTAFALIILCIFKNAKLARIGIPVAIELYIAVVLYESYLYFL